MKYDYERLSPSPLANRRQHVACEWINKCTHGNKSLVAARTCKATCVSSSLRRTCVQLGYPQAQIRGKPILRFPCVLFLLSYKTFLQHVCNAIMSVSVAQIFFFRYSWITSWPVYQFLIFVFRNKVAFSSPSTVALELYWDYEGLSTQAMSGLKFTL